MGKFEDQSGPGKEEGNDDKEFDEITAGLENELISGLAESAMQDLDAPQEVGSDPEVDDFNRELFDMLDALEAEEPEVNKGPRPIVVKDALHQMYGAMWAKGSNAGSMLDYSSPTAEIRVEGPIDFEIDRQKLLLKLAEQGSQKPGFFEWSSPSPWLTVEKGDGEGQIYYLESLPDGRDGWWKEYPVQVRNAKMLECIDRNLPCDEPEVVLMHWEEIPGRSPKFTYRDMSEPGTLPRKLVRVPVDGPPEDRCTLEFPHANFLLPETDPRHPSNWTQVRVRNYLRNILYPALGIPKLQEGE